MQQPQAQQVPGVGGAAVLPVDDVVDLDEPVRGAAGDAAAAVAAFDDAAGPVRDDVLRTTDREREAVVFEHDRDQIGDARLVIREEDQRQRRQRLRLLARPAGGGVTPGRGPAQSSYVGPGRGRIRRGNEEDGGREHW